MDIDAKAVGTLVLYTQLKREVAKVGECIKTKYILVGGTSKTLYFCHVCTILHWNYSQSHSRALTERGSVIPARANAFLPIADWKTYLYHG